MHYLEQSLSGEFYPSGISGENNRILQNSTGIEMNMRTIRQRDLHPLSRRNGNRDFLFGKRILVESFGNIHCPCHQCNRRCDLCGITGNSAEYPNIGGTYLQ